METCLIKLSETSAPLKPQCDTCKSFAVTSLTHCENGSIQVSCGGCGRIYTAYTPPLTLEQKLDQFLQEALGGTARQVELGMNRSMTVRVEVNIINLMKIAGGEWADVATKYEAMQTMLAAGPRY